MILDDAYIVTDLGYGDAGKGGVVDALARSFSIPPVVIRHNGGPQAAHNVVDSLGREHTFSQFGSATFVKNALTYLSNWCLINPLNMAAEELHLRQLGITDAYDRTFVNSDSFIITPYQKAMNRLTELMRGNKRHGSCGQGIGVTRQDIEKWPIMMLRAEDCLNLRTVYDKLDFWRQIKRTEATHGAYARIDSIEKAVFHDDNLIDHLVDFYGEWAKKITLTVGNPTMFARPMIFEGAQGVLLDEWRGFHPYTTWSNTTTRLAGQILRRSHFTGHIHSIGVIRAYQTRHGPGPFVTEDENANFPEAHNGTGAWQGAFRRGWLDLVATKYALEVSEGIDKLAITHMDTVEPVEALPVCTAYSNVQRLKPCERPNLSYQEHLASLCDRADPLYVKVGRDNRASTIAGMLGLPLFMESWGPTAEDKIFH